MQLHPEYINYERQFDTNYKKENRPNYKKVLQGINKRRWLKYKGKLAKIHKIYQRTHLDKFREYGKKYYLKNRDKRLAYFREKYRQKHPIKL